MANQQALIEIAREIEALKRPCGMDPESPIAIQNGRYMSLSYKVRELAALVEAQLSTPSATVALSDDLRDRLVAISKAIADQDDRAAQAMLREILAAPKLSPSATKRICNICQGTGIVKGLHNWGSGGTREEKCWNCHEARQPTPTARAGSQPALEYVDNDMFKGETIEKAAEYWANWCDVWCMTGLSEFLRVVAARAQADSVCYEYAKQIAESMWATHYKADAPHWESCDSLMGVLFQISNMMCGLSRAPADSVTAPAGGGAVVEWHAPGLGEVHNESHGQLIFCTDGDDVADDTLARRVCAALNATPPAQAADSVLEDAAPWIDLTGCIRTDAAQDGSQAKGMRWAASRWKDEVENRPLSNIHRRTLDDVWRQVVRYFGGIPGALLGPSHDELLDAARKQGGA